MRHGVVDTFDASITASVVGAGHEFVYASEFVHGGRELGAELRSVVRQEVGQVSLEMDVAVHQEFGSVFCGEFVFGEHVHTETEMIRKRM